MKAYLSLARADRFRVMKNDELNLVLLGMVRYLGHNNPVLSGVAFNEVRYPRYDDYITKYC
jgi:hypothetical protein